MSGVTRELVRQQVEDVKIGSSDYLLIRFCQGSQSLLRLLAQWETWLLRAKLAGIAIDRPVFVTGLARSGSTLLLELLAGAEGVATHRYRDFPFLMIPYLWNRYLDQFPSDSPLVERAHRDRIFINRESPEAMEEPLWRAFFPRIHSAAEHRMTTVDGSADFERFYTAHIRKLLLIRKGWRYVAKGNYHVPRIEYLAHLFPDARFVVPVRHPLAHVDSLMRQHQLFNGYAADDARVPRYLQALGHFEFGPQRLSIRLNAAQGDRIVQAWSRGEDHLGYGIQWNEVYGFVQTLRKSHRDLAARILIVRYEDLCASPVSCLRRLLRDTELDILGTGPVLDQLGRVTKSPSAPLLDDELRRAIWAETNDVAKSYGYSLDD